MDFAVSADHKVTKTKAKKSTNTWILPENWKTVKHEGDSDTNYSWHPWNGSQVSKKRLEELEIRKIEAIPTIELLKSTRVLKRVMETWGDFLSLRLPWKTANQN